MNTKNRNRVPFEFANINMLGKCNADCFFCLGKDIKNILCNHNHLSIHFSKWENLDKFFDICNKFNIKKIYLTGQNTDPLLYKYLDELICYIQEVKGFLCGIRTNGYLALEKIDSINKCKDEIGYSIHSLNSDENFKILKRKDILWWDKILRLTTSPVRVSIVITRYNINSVLDTIKVLSTYKNIRYIQIRKISTETRCDFLSEDIKTFEEFYYSIAKKYRKKNTIYKDADIFEIWGKDLIFWRTVDTSVNSINYFTDGIISEQYFIIEGYVNEKSKYRTIT